jgi:penicillin G amidase
MPPRLRQAQGWLVPACVGVLTSALWRRVGGWTLRPFDKLRAQDSGLRTQGGPAPSRRRPGSLGLPGLEREVWICRDDAGIPQVHAETERDLAFGLGVAMAQDRLWQMETLRRLAGGRLAELLGDRPLGVKSLHMPGVTILGVDQFYRSLRMYPGAREERSLLSPDGLIALEGFAAGVNAWLGRSPARDLPLECLLLRTRPAPWIPEDSLAIGKLIGWLLSLAFSAKPILGALAADPALHPLLPPPLDRGICILGGGLPDRGAGLDFLARQALGLAGPGIGSNSWVVSGRRTASGKPLVCNDPHLLFGLPALWYPVALHGPRHRVIGGTMPGVPAVLIGRNEDLAWGFTAVMADDGDYYRETLDPSGARYLRGGTWHDVEVLEEEFRVRGRPRGRRLGLPFVRHGESLCPLLPREGDGPPTSFRWVGFEPWGTLDALLEMNRSRSVSEFEGAVEGFAVPAQNVVVADRHGAIAYFCAGKFPRRPWVNSTLRQAQGSPQAGRGPVILEGDSPQHAWQGYLSWAEHPRAVDPPEGFLATANNRVAAEPPPSIDCGFWEPPYRAARISGRLLDCSQATAEDMAKIQTDIHSVQAAGILAKLVRPAAEGLRDAHAQQAASLLLRWDLRMTSEDAAPAVFHLFYQQLLQRCFRPVLEGHAPGLFARYFSLLHLAVPSADAALMRGDPAWFPGGVDQVVELSLSAAWQEAIHRLGDDPTRWRWGSLHTLTFFHGLGRGQDRMVRTLDWLFRLNRGPYPRPGDGMTVNLGAFPLTAPFGVMAGPSYRHIVDLGDPETSRWCLAGGTSGDPRSPHYADQIEPWLRGAYRPMRLCSRSESCGETSLHLLPAR